MQRVESLEQVQGNHPTVVTVGMFDGIHRGHEYLIQQLVEQAHTHDQQVAVISFFPHPDVVLQNITGRYYLTSIDQKTALLQSMGVDILVLHPFDAQVRQMRAALFVDRLLDHLNMQALWATENFALGYEREGNIDFLRQQGQEKNFTVRTVDLVTPSDPPEKISSTRIRNALAEGDLVSVETWLGRPYAVRGEVVHGDHRGRTIGFPTANVQSWAQQLIPANGVYACHVTHQDTEYIAAVNVGQRPTFDGDGITVEAHLLDFDGDLYGETLTVTFLHRLRGEQKFDGIDALIAQIRADAERTRDLLG